MSIDKSLFHGDLVTLATVDAQNDAELISKWTHNASTTHQWDSDPLQPLSAWKVTKMLEKMEVEGKQREYLNREGRRWDMVFMGILKDDWMKTGST